MLNSCIIIIATLVRKNSNKRILAGKKYVIFIHVVWRKPGQRSAILFQVGASNFSDIQKRADEHGCPPASYSIVTVGSFPGLNAGDV
jgi:hypothetical protein